MTTRTFYAFLAALAFALPLCAAAATATIVGSPSSSAIIGMPVMFNVSADGFSGTPTFSVSDSFVGSSILPFNITNGGAFNWTPQSQDVGNHNLTVTVGDGAATSTARYSIFVNTPASAEIQSLRPGTTVNPGQNVTFSVGARGFGAPSYSVVDSFAGSSLATSSISNSGYFTWTPTSDDAGIHTLLVTVTDPQAHSATASTTITVSSVPHVTVSGPSSAVVGTSVSLTLTAPGFTSPQFTVRDSNSASSVSAASVASSTFTWVPTSRDIGSHLLIISVADPLAHTANTTYTLEIRSATASRNGLTSAQIESILNLLSAFGADKAVIDNVSTILGAGQVLGAQVRRLERGMQGDDVTALQELLAGGGFFSGQMTGYFGPQTEAAVRAFQKAHGIDTVGFVGPATRAALGL